MGPSLFISHPERASRWPRRLLLTVIVTLSSSLFGPVGSAAEKNTGVIVGTADLPGATASPAGPQAASSPAPSAQTTEYMGTNLCPDHSGNYVNLQKSLAITRFLRNSPQSANAGNLFAAESELPALIRAQLTNNLLTVSPTVLNYGFAAPSLTDSQLKQQTQKIARQARTQFVLSGTIDNMSISTPDAIYHPTLYRQAANAFHDITTIKKFDKRTRTLNLSIQLRDGFTGEVLFDKQFSTAGIWNTREPVGFDSPAFYKTHYGEQVKALTEKISREVARVVHCQPFMASIDSQPGQTNILLHGGANNGLHAGDTLSLYQMVVVGSNTEYQVNETRLVKRNTRLYLSEVYPSHSIAQVEGGSYLNGFYLAVGE